MIFFILCKQQMIWAKNYNLLKHASVCQLKRETAEMALFMKTFVVKAVIYVGWVYGDVFCTESEKLFKKMQIEESGSNDCLIKGQIHIFCFFYVDCWHYVALFFHYCHALCFGKKEEVKRHGETQKLTGSFFAWLTSCNARNWQ